MPELHDLLGDAEERGRIPAVEAYHRIDGPGSTLDMREFQQALWRLPDLPGNPESDPGVPWSAALPRTVCLTLSTGTRVSAHPFEAGRLAVYSVDYDEEVAADAGRVATSTENWLLKAADVLGLSGVRFQVENLDPGLLSSGLGGSATVMTAVCLLANRLAGDPMDGHQIVTLASRLEQDLGASLTGTQEQWNVVHGGVTDYLWFPWGIPGRLRQGLGTCMRFTLVPEERHAEVERRMAIFHTGDSRAGSEVNARWASALRQPSQFPRLTELTAGAYDYREGLRTGDWERVAASMAAYRAIRTETVPEYMAGAEAMARITQSRGGEAFPLGAGGGGAALVFAPDPADLRDIRSELSRDYREIPVELRSRGHRFLEG